MAHVDDPWSIWQVLVTGLSGGGLFTAIGGLLWVGRKYGQNEESVKSLRTDLDKHVASDATMFSELKSSMAENANKQDIRHEENLKAIGKLPDREDIRDLRADLARRFEVVEGLVRVRPPN